MASFNKCHSEQSEESSNYIRRIGNRKILRSALDDRRRIIHIICSNNQTA